VVDAITGDLKFSCDAHHEYCVLCVAYSPDGKAIATCSDDGTISVWNAEDGHNLLGPFNCEAEAVSSIAFSPDGNFLLSGNAHLLAIF
jgi:WD40 repeat protein